MLETFLLVDYTYTFLPNNASFYFLLSPFPLLYPISPFPSILSFFLSFSGPFYLLFLYLFFPSLCHPLIPPSFPSSSVYAISQVMTHFKAMSIGICHTHTQTLKYVRDLKTVKNKNLGEVSTKLRLNIIILNRNH